MNEQTAIAVVNAMIIADEYHLETGEHYVVIIDNNDAISIEIMPSVLDFDRDYLYATDGDLDDEITGCDDAHTH